MDRVLGKHNEDPYRNLDSAYSSSMNALSQYVLASTVFDEFDHEEEVSHTTIVATTLLDSDASSFNQEANIEEPCFLCLLK